jgi:quinol monooxygenase YgiN
MVMTILQAQVSPAQSERLEAAFQEAVKTLDPGILQTFCVRSTKVPTMWRIITVWESRAALDAMRASGETPRGVQIFREALAEPTLMVFDVIGRGG